MHTPFDSGYSLQKVAYRHPCIHAYKVIKMDSADSSLKAGTLPYINFSLCWIIAHKLETFYSSILDKKQKKHLDFISPSSLSPIFYLPFRTNSSKGLLILNTRVPVPLLPFFLESTTIRPLFLTQNCSCQGHPLSHTVKFNGQFSVLVIWHSWLSLSGFQGITFPWFLS